MEIQLGQKARDVITGFEGVVVGVVEYITGCKQYVLAPRVKESGNYQESHWFDVDRVERLGDAPPIRLATATSDGPDAPAPLK